jgi:hypothetical protein
MAVIPASPEIPIVKNVVSGLPAIIFTKQMVFFTDQIPTLLLILIPLSKE